MSRNLKCDAERSFQSRITEFSFAAVAVAIDPPTGKFAVVDVDVTPAGFTSRAANPRDSSRKNIVRGRGSSLCARAKDASLLFICEMTFNSDDGEISRRNFFGAGPHEGRPQPGRYYFVGRLTNDYAGATFAKTKKTLSLNHKEPLGTRGADAAYNTRGVSDEGFGSAFFARPTRRDLSSSKEDSSVFIFHLMSLFFRTPNTSARWILREETVSRRCAGSFGLGVKIHKTVRQSKRPPLQIANCAVFWSAIFSYSAIRRITNFGAHERIGK